MDGISTTQRISRLQERLEDLQAAAGDDHDLSQALREAATEAAAIARQLAEEREATPCCPPNGGRLHQILDGVSEAIITLDAQWRLVYANNHAEELLGMRREHVVGRPVADVLPEAVNSPFHRACQRAMNLQKPTTVGAYFHPTRRWYEARAYPSPTGVTVLLRDVTERRHTIRSLHESLLRERAKAAELAATMRAVPVAVLIAHDLEGRVITGNRAAYQLLRREEGSNVSILAPEAADLPPLRYERDGEPLAPADMPLRRAARGEEVRECEFDIVFADGEVRHIFGNATPLVDDQGNTVGAVAAYLDITDRKRMEQQLRDSEEWFRVLAESLPQLVWTARPDGQYDYFGSCWYEFTGVPADAQYGLNWLNLLHPDDRERVAEAWRRAVADGAPYDVEYRLRQGDGAYRWVKSRGMPVRDANGAILKWYGCSTDVDNLKRLEDEHRRQREFLEKLVANSPVGIAVVEGPELRYRLANAAYAETHGTTVDRLLGATMADALGEDAAPLADYARRALATGRPVFLDPRPAHLSSANEVWLSTQYVPLLGHSAQPQAVLLLVEDVTDQVIAWRKAEESAANSARSLALARAVMSSMDQALLIVDANGAVVDANRAAARFLCPENASPVGRLLVDLLAAFTAATPDGRSLSHSELATAVLVGRKLDGVELRSWQDPPGAHWVGLLSAAPVQGSETADRLAVVTITDISSRKQIEDALRRANERLATVLESMADAYVAYDANWRILEVNATAARELFGSAADQLVGMVVWDACPSLADSEFRRQHEAAMALARPTSFEVHSPVLDNWWEAHAYPRGESFEVYLKGITARKQAEERLQESHRVLDALMEHIPEGITIADAPSLQVRMVSTYGAELLARTRASMQNTPFAEQIAAGEPFRPDGVTPYPPDELPLARAVRGEVVTDEEIVIRRPDGRVIRVLCNAGPIRDDEGNVTGGVMAWRDATEMSDARHQVQMTLHREHYIAYTLQQALLPARPISWPGYQSAATYLPARSHELVGGDFYDLFQTTDGRIGLLIGDVSGKGVEAAALAAACRSTVRTLAFEGLAPAEALKRADAVLFSQANPADSFVTLVLAVLNPSTGEIEYCCAGHPLPVVARSDGTFELLKQGGPPLGMPGAVEYQTLRAHLGPGDSLVLYTDGVWEARGLAGEFGTHGVERTLARFRGSSPNIVAACISEAARDWSGGTLTDDVAVLVVTRDAEAQDAELAPMGSLRLSMPAELHSVPEVRREVSTMLRRLNVGEDDVARAQVIVTEACANAVRHAYERAGHRYHASVDAYPNRVVLTIEDAGKGFDPDAVPAPQVGQIGGYGLMLIRHTADALHVSSRPGQGTRLVAELRFPEPEA